MVEQIEIEKTKDDDELEMLLGEIPHATSSLTHLQNLNHHHNHHQSHDNNDNDNDDYGHYCSGTMKDMMYGMYHDNPSCSYRQNTSSPASFSSFFSKQDDPITKSHMLFKTCTSVLPNSYVRKKIDPINFTKPLSRNHVSESNTSPIFGLQHSYGFPEIQVPDNLYPQSGLDRNVSCVRYPLSYQSRIRGLDLAVADNLYRVQSNGMLESNEDSLIIQGESESAVNHVRNGSFRQNKKCNHSQFAGGCENGRFSKGYRSFSTPVRCNTLADVKGYIYMFAKEQNGCRFIQSVFDEENPKHVEMVFDDTIGHVNELMVNPFGNYLMQKLLEVCNEEQRMCILMEVTRDLVHISLNTHGTRAVQKLIETLKTRKQIKIVISALEPGFLALIKDLNGNHVIQRCLQCLSNEDNKFIFEAASKFCVDIATHQHGCCVLQRCINHSTGKHQERLILEISANGLLLAQDAFGNYVVQSILELQIPCAVSMLTSQFEGNYVHLARQKFSSHVVEKCLSVLDDHSRSKIIRELLSATHFEQLLQDPHANYVVQTALRVAEGSLHNLLVKAIESHKAVSRNSPYSKRIFSHKLLKK
ncbi:hypothetical protein QVD17_27429 [Tagetes erecta]|uniref:PUM-HD domain-containing protein n=1 Tax=Tagetes erecta TaxID=13708 RepID=A0AAD8KBV2_TARER|nr:hypothetical protein QVD17_27429 [Tagetes erecta]